MVLVKLQEDFATRTKPIAFLAAVVSALAMQSAASACTITPGAGGVFLGHGLIGQYCWIDPPQHGAVAGQCWGCTGGGWSGPRRLASFYRDSRTFWPAD